MKNKHLIVVSVDALVYEDLEYAKTLPNFGRLIKSGAIIERVRTIYPSLTHPVHASIISGAPAGVTKIVNNATLAPGKDGAWYNMLDEMAKEGIYGFERVFTLDEVKTQYGLSGDFSFVKNLLPKGPDCRGNSLFASCYKYRCIYILL